MSRILQRLTLFGIAVLCGLFLIYPGLAQESDRKANAIKATTATGPDTADMAVAAAVNGVTGAVQKATSQVTKDNAAAAEVANGVKSVLQTEIFGFTTGQLGACFLILLASLLFRNILSRAVIARLLRFADRSNLLNRNLVEALTKPLSAFLLIGGIYLALLALPLSPEANAFLGNLFRGLSMLSIVWAALLLSDVLADFITSRIAATPDSVVAGFAPLIKKSLKIFVFIIGLLMTIDNLGYNVTGIIATLGLGTAAVALASQDTLKNAFGALMIALDRPFKVGDWIQVSDKVDGNVESIGLRSTKVRTWPKTLLSIPNGVLANEYINNWSQMPKRRVKQVVGITYEASAKDMQNLVDDIRKILAADPGVHQEFILVNFTDFGDSSLDILVYYFTTTIAWLEYMDIRQRINCAIMEAIHARSLSVAFPTRTLYLDGPAANQMAGTPYQSRWTADAELPGDFGPQSPP